MNFSPLFEPQKRTESCGRGGYRRPLRTWASRTLKSLNERHRRLLDDALETRPLPARYELAARHGYCSPWVGLILRSPPALEYFEMRSRARIRAARKEKRP